jgi:hypothetical protein
MGARYIAGHRHDRAPRPAVKPSAGRGLATSTLAAVPIAFEIGSTGNGRNPMFNGRRKPSCGGTSRRTRECQVRICERLGVKFPGPTRQKPALPRRSIAVRFALKKQTPTERVQCDAMCQDRTHALQQTNPIRSPRRHAAGTRG